MLGHVTDNSSKLTSLRLKGWGVKGGIAQNACWRLGGGEALQTLKRDSAIPKRQRLKFIPKKCNELSLACAQRSVAA